MEPTDKETVYYIPESDSKTITFIVEKSDILNAMLSNIRPYTLQRRQELEQQLDEVIKDHFTDAAEGVILLANWFYDECMSYNIDKVYKGFYLTKDMKEFKRINNK